MKSVSVVIPCYNASAYIAKCIDALERQTCRDFRVILVDDCSQDNTMEVLLGIQKSSPLDVTILQNAANSGPAFSRNAGIDVADTEYITFCDSDDWYEPDFLKVLHDLLADNNADIAFCGYLVVDENANAVVRPLTSTEGCITKSEAFCLDADSLCMLMVRTSIMKDTKLPDLRNGEDVATVPLLMTKANRFAATDKCLYNYFRRSDSASEQPSMRVVDSLAASFSYTKKRFPQEYRAELEFLGAKNLLYATIITLFSFGYDKKRACSILDEFEKEFPLWYRNPYLSNLRSYKRIVLFFVHHRLFACVRMISVVRNMLNK